MITSQNAAAMRDTLMGKPNFQKHGIKPLGNSALAQAGVWIVIPCFKVETKINDVLTSLPDWIEGVVIVDDQCPNKSGDTASLYWAENKINDDRLEVIKHCKNLGVGGAVLTGYKKAIESGAKIIIKIDGDDQMDMRFIPALIIPITSGTADYTKGNRFSSIAHVEGMPPLRVFGNSVLSLINKISSGYWNLFDPTNGFTAIHARVATELLERRIEHRYFFESDLLYHLGVLRAVVKDVPMPSRYADEDSNLKITSIIFPFLGFHFRNFCKRLAGQYIVRDFSIASLETFFGIIAILIGAFIGADWFLSRESADIAASPGIVVGTVAPFIVGIQLLLSALNYDVMSIPREPIHPMLKAIDKFSDTD